MGIEKLVKVLPKLKSLGCSGKIPAKKLESIKPSIFKELSEKTKIKMSKPVKIKELKSKPTTPQESINYMVKQQAKQTEYLFTENFALKKQNLIRELSKVCDKDVITRIEKADTPEKLANILTEQEWSPIGKYTKYMIDGKFVKGTNLGKVAKPLTLEMEQIQYQLRNQRGNFILARERGMHVPSKNPKVIAIENILKEQYGCKFVSLKDNEELAKKVLKAYETAAKNGVKTPKNVVASDFMFAEGENLFNSTIILNRAQKDLAKSFLSTNSDFHVPLHEILHGTHPKLVSFSSKKIPSQFQKVKSELSGYSKVSPTHETFTELNTKRLIDGLNKEEQALFDYLNVFA